MKILHLSDLHYGSNSYTKFSDNKILDKLCDKLTTHKDNIDLVVFSGDLVYNGTKSEAFIDANNIFLKRIANSLNIPLNNIIICAGNHDIDRKCKRTSLELLFESIDSSNKLNDFVIKKDEDYTNSLLNLKNYNSFINDFYNDSNLIKHDLYTIHKKEIRGEKHGIVSINSAWRAFEDKSQEKLLFPIILLQDILKNIKDCKCKFIIIHHPLYYFKEFNYIELQELIHKEFDIIFSGHIHQSEVNVHYKNNNGIYAPVASASMTYDKSYIGYTINEYDCINKSQIISIDAKFNDVKSEFIEENPIVIHIPCSVEKESQNNNRKKIQNKVNNELLNGKDLLLSSNSENESTEIFLELFSTPLLKTRSKADISSKDSQSNKDFNDLLINETNYFIYGHDKSGKSSLLKYIQIKHLKEFSKHGIIPFYIDFRELEYIIDEKWDIETYMSKYFELSRGKTIELIKNHSFILLIDNFDHTKHLFNLLDKFLIKYENVNFIICCDHLTSRIVEEYSIGKREYQKLYLHDISRNDIHNYAEKWTHSQIEKKEILIDKIVSFCKQLEMPLTYWTVSLLLLIHKKSSFDLSKNLFELLDLSVDEILNKKYITLTKSKVTFNQLKRICGKLAGFLLLKYNENIYSAPYYKILEFLEKEVESNIRLTANAKEILDYLLDSGVLKLREDDKITFRLNGIFEYFIAFNMANEEFQYKELMGENSDYDTLKDKIINDDSIYLSFKNEIEIYSGLKNRDINFLKEIYQKTKKFFYEINESFRLEGTPDQLLIKRVTIETEKDLEETTKKIKAIKPFEEKDSNIVKDEFEQTNTQSSVTHKRLYDISQVTPEIYERFISVLARVYKTMDEISDTKTLNEIFDFLLETYSNFGFYLIEKFQQEDSDEFKALDPEKREDILELITNFIPILAQVSFSDGIAHYNVESIILNKIEELKANSKSNQFHLFMLYFILMDIDEKNIQKYTDELLEIAQIGILKFSTIMKLNYYFAFNGHRNKKIADFLKLKIEEAQMKLNEKTDRSRLQQGLEKRSKINLLKK